MSLLAVVLPAAIVLILAYAIYGTVLSRLLKLDAGARTPAEELRDNVDFVPTEQKFLLSQHFSAIAAAGPIVGPILAGLAFGWLPALLWILAGSILIGGVHDLTALTASIRHRARSIAEVVREHMSHRSYLLFLSFIWIALVYIIVAFTDVTAASFVGPATAENGGVGGGAIATTSLIYLLLTILMGGCLKYARTPLGWTTAVFIVLVGVAIVFGPQIPLDLAQAQYEPAPGAAADLYSAAAQNDATAIATIAQARKSWDVAILVYCLLAGIAPVWLILQPRGQLGGWFLYVALAAGLIGLTLGGAQIRYPAFRGWEIPAEGQAGMAMTLFPILFITIACGACSGFHALIASGTTSKQLRRETDAKPIGYGAMMLEAMVAIVSLSCVMMFVEGSAELKGSPNQIYAQGLSNFLDAVNIPRAIGMSFALMAFATFVYDTLDVCTRLGRFIVQELTGLRNAWGRLTGSALTVGAPLWFLLSAPNSITGANGITRPAPPVWRTFWNLFGASNQLLAALTLLGVTVWLWRTRRAWWVWMVTGLPTVWMYVMSTWALFRMTLPHFRDANGEFQVPADPVPWAGCVLIALAALMLVEAILALSVRTPPRAAAVPAVAG